MEFLVNAKFDFVSKRKAALVFSGTLILVGLGSLIVHKGPHYGIDFLGGTSIELEFEQPIAISDVRSAVSKAGFGKAEIKNFGAPNEILIRVQALRRSPSWAILIAPLGILMYISWRFEFTFAVGAIVALFHDVLITLGVFSVLGLEISLAIIAAFLTIVGYSLNDTIVVFDRIRENLKVLRRETYEAVVNTSINQSLTRTIVTSLTTLAVVTILYFFGGAVIHNFAFALIIGVLIGTYSFTTFRKNHGRPRCLAAQR